MKSVWNFTRTAYRSPALFWWGQCWSYILVFRVETETANPSGEHVFAPVFDGVRAARF